MIRCGWTALGAEDGAAAEEDDEAAAAAAADDDEEEAASADEPLARLLPSLFAAPLAAGFAAVAAALLTSIDAAA